MESENYFARPEASAVSEATLIRLLFAREQRLMEGTAESLALAGRMDALLSRAVKQRSPASKDPVGRLMLALTRACQLRCPYCTMSKEGGHMSPELVRRGVELLFAGAHEELQLHFFGGEPLLKFDLLQQAVLLAESLKERRGKRIRYYVTTNGLALEKTVLDFLRQFNFTVEFSFDGKEETYGLQRPAARGDNLYGRVRARLDGLRDSGVPYHITMVVSPESAERLGENVSHLIEMGHKRIQVNYQNNVYWSPEALRRLVSALGGIAQEARLSRFEFLNLDCRREPVMLHSELLLDVDGNIYPNIGILLEENFGVTLSDFLIADSASIKTLDEYQLTSFDTFWLLSSVYGRRNPDLRRLILNLITVGLTVEEGLQPWSCATGDRSSAERTMTRELLHLARA